MHEVLKKIVEKVLSVLGLIVAIWLLCPLPEISIIIGLIGGSSVHAYFEIPAWSSYVGSIIGAIIGTLVLKKLSWLEKMKDFVREKFRKKN